MKHVCITHIDAVTGVLCTNASMANGPTFPELSGFVFNWANQSIWPIACNADGSYTVAPKFYGTCDDTANTSVVGVLEVLTEETWNALKQAEIENLRPFASWVWNEDEWMWKPPFPRPDDAIVHGGTVQYKWDEATVNWVAV